MKADNYLLQTNKHHGYITTTRRRMNHTQQKSVTK